MQPTPSEHEIGGVVTIQFFEVIFANILALAIRAAGLVCFLLLIVGGFKYLTSGGDPKQTASAQATLTWAIGGFVVIIATWLILKFIDYFTGVPVTVFEIPR